MNLRKILLNSVLVLFFCAIGLAVVEMGARLMLGAPKQTAGVLFFSAEVFQNTSTGTVRFSPGREFRAISVFGDEVEFDVRFKTNNLGLVDQQNYPLAENPRNIAIVGDSFTAGYHGGDPWVAGLRGKVENANFYNLGITGAGFVQFDRLQSDLAGKLGLSETLIVAISSDVKRKPWRTVKHEGRLFFCATETETSDCLKQNSSVYTLDGNETEADIFATAKAHTEKYQKPGLRRYLSRHTHVGKIFHSRTWRKRSKKLDVEPVAEIAVNALKHMKNRLGNSLTLLHLPERREVEAGTYSTDLKTLAESLNIRFVSGLKTCEMSAGDYYPRDSHPNQTGYGKIQNCVANILNTVKN